MSVIDSRIRILLLQARNPGDPARGEELRAFVDRTAVAAEQIVPWDLLQGPPALSEVRLHDALMVGGSGEFYVSKRNLPHHQAFLDLLLEVVEAGHPTLASCFGFHCLVQALGGEVVHDPDNTEVGTFELTLTRDGRGDELFGRLPGRFFAQLGHKDRAAGAVDGVPNLASSERAPVQALRIPGKPIWATQFHPELDRCANLARYERYLAIYAATLTADELRRSMDSFRESPATHDLLARFVRLVFG